MYAGKTQGKEFTEEKGAKVEAFCTWRILPSSGRMCMLKRSTAVVGSGRERGLDHWISTPREQRRRHAQQEQL
jgi:hypothetical protein